MTPTELDQERSLVQLAQAGDRGAFRALAELHVAGLLRNAVALGCRDRAAAEDLAQEVLLEAWRSLARYDGSSRFGTWLFGILRNRWLKFLSRRTPVVSVELAALGGAVSQVEPAQSGPVQALMREESASELRAAVAGLPDGQRQVIELRFFKGASLEEISAELACPLGTVKSRLHHALEKLRLALESLCQQDFD